MSSSRTELDIANRALIKLGEPTITSLDANSKSARAMNNVLDATRDSLLRENPWSFATKRVALSADVTDPVYEYDSSYRLPTDFLYLISIKDDVDYRMEGDFIACDVSGTLYITYVARLTDVSRYDSSITEAWASLMAYEACMYIGADMSLRDRMYNEYRGNLFTAKKFDGQQNHSMELPLDDFLTSRY